MNHVPNRHAAEPATTGRGKPRLAIVSTYDELCGIAGYTRALEAQLAPHFEFTVFELDQYLIRSPYRRVQRMADAHVKQIAASLKGFDCVNIQLEHGTLGRTHAQIARRLRRLVEAAPALSVTFHTILTPETLDVGEVWGKLLRLNLVGAWKVVAGHRKRSVLQRVSYGLLRSSQARKPVSAIVHTKRDMRLLRDVQGIADVHHHPLSYITPAYRDAVRAAATRADFPSLDGLPTDATLIGSFGFLSPYKGFETAIRALRHLPENHHLLIFGGVHPQTITKQKPIDDYVQKLLDEAYIDRTVFDPAESNAAPVAGPLNASITIDATTRDLLATHPKSLAGRIHFMGALRDDDFYRAMAICDAVVLPYMEVGQSSSGPVSMALDMGCRVIASRTQTFMQLARYHKDRMEFFDIGNHVELAERIKAGARQAREAIPLEYNTETNAQVYVLANAPGLRGTPPSALRVGILEPAEVMS